MFFSILGIAGHSQHSHYLGNNHRVSPLFEEEKLLKIFLNYSKKDILESTNDSTYIWSSLSYQKEDKSLETIKIQIRARGNFRKQYCYYLPLKIKIKKELSQATIFREDKKLKLVLPCLDSYKSNDHVVKEFLAYKIFELISPYHFETKLLSIQFKEKRNRKTIDHDLLGIFIQDDDQIALLNNGKMIKRNIHPQAQDTLGSSRNALFQYMIGNTDFSIAYRHNEKLLLVDDKIVPIPYDFDMSGFVNSSYAVVSAINNRALPIATVTERLFRGFERGDLVLEETRREFLNYEDAIYKLLDQHKIYFKDPQEFLECKKYVESFYDIIKDDKKFQKKILQKQRKSLLE